jgi:hypothetical protein
VEPQSKGSMGRYGSGILPPLISLRLWTTLVSDEEANVIWGLPGDNLWIPPRSLLQMEGEKGFDDPLGIVRHP